MDRMDIRVSDYTRYPGPRYKKDGAFSGEDFRERVLTKLMRQAIDQNDVIEVILDNVSGYGSSFLDEAFAGLIRNGFTSDEVRRHLRLKAGASRFEHHVVAAKQYIIDEARRRT